MRRITRLQEQRCRYGAPRQARNGGETAIAWINDTRHHNAKRQENTVTRSRTAYAVTLSQHNDEALVMMTPPLRSVHET